MQTCNGAAKSAQNRFLHLQTNKRMINNVQLMNLCVFVLRSGRYSGKRWDQLAPLSYDVPEHAICNIRFKRTILSGKKTSYASDHFFKIVQLTFTSVKCRTTITHCIKMESKGNKTRTKRHSFRWMIYKEKVLVYGRVGKKIARMISCMLHGLKETSTTHYPMIHSHLYHQRWRNVSHVQSRRDPTIYMEVSF